MTKPLPKGWRRVRLGEVLELVTDSVPVKPERRYPMVGIYSFGKGLFLREAVTGSKSSYKQFFRLRTGDLVMSQLFGWEGALAICTDDFSGMFVSPHFPTYHCRDEQMDIGYLGCLVKTRYIWKELGKRTKGIGDRRRTLNAKDLLEIPVNLPPLSEQKRIAAALQSIDAAIRANEDVIEKTRDLKKSLANELLTRGFPGRHTRFKDSPIGKIPAEWEVKRLGDLTRHSAFGPRFEGGLYDPCGNIACLRTTDISDDGTINYSTAPRARLDNAKFASHILEGGDLLVTRSGTCGIATIFEEQSIPFVAGAFLIRIQLTDPVIPSFVQIWINSPAGRPHIDRLAFGGVQKNISGTSLSSLPIPLPPIDEQRSILDAIRAVKDDEHELVYLTTLRSTLRDTLLAGAT